MQNSPLYFVGHLGYASFRYDNDAYDTNGGLYYALGGGMDLGQKYEAEVLYTSNSGELDNDSSQDVDYSKITVTFGMRF